MKHKFLTILLALVTVLCLVACGGNGGTGSSGSDTEQGTQKPDDGNKDPDKDDKDPDEGKDTPEEHEHVYTVENVCGICGEKWEYTEELEYMMIDGTGEGEPTEHELSYCVVGLKEGEEAGDVVLPYGHNGRWVTMIGEDAFNEREDLTGITFPSSITVIGKDSFYGCTSLTRLEIPDSVRMIVDNSFIGCTSLKSLKIGGNTVICEDTFSGCTALTDIELSDSVISIGEDAFYGTGYYNDPANWDESGVLYIGNHLIKGIGVKEGTYTVREGTKTIADFAFESPYYYTTHESEVCHMTGVVLPEGVTYIGDVAFAGCEELASVSIPDSVNHIGYAAFSSTAANQNKANWENGEVLYLGNHLIAAKESLAGNYTIRPNTKTVADNAFQDCTLLTGIEFPDGLVSIGGALFDRCSGLVNVTLPNSVTSLGDFAFRDCEALTEIKLGSGLVSIYSCAFEGCSSLKKITIPASVRELGMRVFSNCSALESIEVEAGNEVFRSEGNCLIQKASNGLIYGCKNSRIPEGVEWIGQYAFEGHSDLKTIYLPSTLTVWGDYIFLNFNIFDGCDALEITVDENNPVVSVEDGILYWKGTAGRRILYINGKISGNYVLPDDLISIENYIFMGCDQLTSIVIPGRVTSIGRMAFDGCRLLTRILFKGTVEEWQAIEKDFLWDSGTGNYIVACTDGMVDKEGNVTYFKQ